MLQSRSSPPVHMVVVDNSGDEKEAQTLKQGLPSEASLLVSPENLGFARACNLAFERFEGDPVLLLNPDARLLPDCLTHLNHTLLSSSRIASASPHMFWDDALQFHIPPSVPPFLFEIQSFFASWGPEAAVNRVLSGLWRSKCVKTWLGEKPISANYFSGGHVLLKREAVLRAGGLFDPDFFLYFEDTDLSIRLRKKGFQLMMEPRAKGVHYVDQCGQDERGHKRTLMAESHARWRRKHGNRIGPIIRQAWDRCRALFPVHQDQGSPPDFTAPFTLPVPLSIENRWLFEISPNPTFIPSVGQFGAGSVAGLSQREWEMLAPGTYFGRLGKPLGLKRGDPSVSIKIQKMFQAHG